MFVVYEVRSTMEQKSYKRAGDAARYAAKLNERERKHWGDDARYEEHGLHYASTTREDYEKNVVHMVERKNLMSGKMYWEKSNTPSYCSPASEAYWSA